MDSNSTTVATGIQGDANRVGELERLCAESVKLKELLEERLRFEKLLSEISSLFSNLPPREVDSTIVHGLRSIGEFLGADRCNLVQFLGKDDAVHVFHSWESPGTEPMPNFQTPLGEIFPWAAGRFKQGEILQFYRLEDLPPEAARDRDVLGRYDTKSHLSVPVAVGGSIVGALSIATVSTCRVWPEELVQRLRLVGEIFANALVRKQKELDIQSAFMEIQKLKEQLEADNTYLREELGQEHDFQNIIGQSASLRTVFSKIHQIGPLDSTVLLLGETGTGKELVARAIHGASLRRERPMVKVNCAALPSTLVESELFGHEKGAFTSAQSRQVGRFELANGSTIFLDEIGELPLESQGKLLRVLQEGELERLGSPKTIRVDVRIIAATNRNLEDEVKAGRFRKDLWYRLNVYPITMPPLRHRAEDIPLLVNWFADKFGRKMGKTIKSVPTPVMKTLQGYQWPGNVRELENVIERAVINTWGTSLQLLDTLEPPPAADLPVGPRLTLEETERDYIIQVLAECSGRIDGNRGAAVILGLNPSTLRSKMRKLGIQIQKNPTFD